MVVEREVDGRLGPNTCAVSYCRGEDIPINIIFSRYFSSLSGCWSNLRSFTLST